MYFNNLAHNTFPTSYKINPLNPTVINEYKNGMCNTDNNSFVPDPLFLLLQKLNTPEASGKASVAYGDFVGVLQIILTAVLL